MKWRGLLLCSLMISTVQAQTLIVQDTQRNRAIPVEIYSPPTSCKPDASCPVALLGSGYGVAHTDYGFIAHTLNQQGYLVVAVGHELPGDPPLSREPPFLQTRTENWQRGAQTLKLLHAYLQSEHPEADLTQMILVGHSNGGDIAAWLLRDSSQFATTLITLDHRRVPLPKASNIKVLSIRADDYPADDGVLPDVHTPWPNHPCIRTIEGAKHNDLTDQGPQWLKNRVASLIKNFLQGSCNPIDHKAS
ncbi:alpha/beta hydrolase [Aliiglaciecola sp. CAU 1673]|uniref:alpha/beta hydrolase n=1 Tax=Aliiglaciecola sp. CAU 1673 TaxID=3032595 RepID=UPI0023DBDE70|nr:alpha/beta hydrolase [Aliiglaciecola sp. CAU 1673]MDF2177252.1 alpha/beta hydrolase [Aliiglaciecola sp. CAU 1673]